MMYIFVACWTEKSIVLALHLVFSNIPFVAVFEDLKNSSLPWWVVVITVPQSDSWPIRDYMVYLAKDSSNLYKK